MVLVEIRTTEAWARTYLLRPAVNPAELTSVMILTPQRAAAGLINVWADVGAIVSATKGIVAAGDSLARRSAAAEAAARRAAVDSEARIIADSLRRDTTTTRRDTVTRSRVVAPVPAVPLDSAAKAAQDSVARARIRRARRDSIAARARADSIAFSVPGAVRPPARPPIAGARP